jgi:pimeloyl-ACP methyl ester carboxylesterase
VHSFVEVVPLLVAAGYRVIVPHLRGFGTTRFLSSDTIRNGQQAALALDVVALLDALRIEKAVVAGFDWGARTADIVAALWPERCQGLVAVSGYLIANREVNRAPLTPQAEYAWWYQYYFATDRGERGYSEHRREFARLIWRLASPAWRFDEATFERAARAFDNPDHVRIVIHNYRWRLGIDAGEPQYDALEAALAKAPIISIPAITLQGDADGAPHPDSRAYAAKFSGWYSHRVVAGGVGHNLPQEAPLAFAEAVIDVARVTATNRGVEP